MPSFTYITRAARLPDGCVVNGSIAILVPKKDNDLDVDLSLYATEDFRRYYEIVKNKAKFTLNMDSNSIYYIGVKRYDK
jgi:DNA (cytosine-5)-methyltransferase 1